MQLPPSELLQSGSLELGSYDTISEAHAECLPANNVFVRFFPTTVGTKREQSAGDSDRQVGRLGNGMENRGGGGRGGFGGGDPAEGLWLTE